VSTISSETTDEAQVAAGGLPNQTVLLIHGRSHQPSATNLLRHWRTALERGLERDFPNGPDLNKTLVQLVYYGDLLEALHPENTYSPATELADQEKVLKSLIARKNSKQFRRVHYEALPGKSSFKEFRADISAPLTSVLGMGRKRISKVMPELIDYWDNRNNFQEQVQQRFTALLQPALDRGDRILVIAHCLGSVVAYDTFWKLSRQEIAGDQQARVDTWITIGSPVADDYIRHRLAGGKHHESHEGRVTYPDLINHWINIAAEDDYYCHDETVANDFAAMLSDHLLVQIDDYHIYNLAEHFGQSNPHGALGYLVHPRISHLLAEWLSSDPDTSS
jgi:hypothetical protein